MKKVSNYIKEIGLGWLFKSSVIINILLLIAGFITPPLGIVHGSVLIGIGEIGLIINIPVFFAFAHDKKVNLTADLDDKRLTLLTEGERN